jgi:ketosteroid isomerase-like protein
MSAQENKQSARDGYEAFGRGDAAGAMANISDSVEWVVGGDSAVSGTYHGKEEVGKFWGQLAEKGFQNKPSEFIADGDKVAVIAVGSVGGEEATAVDILTYDGEGQLIRFEAFGGDDVLERAFPK